MTGVWAVVVAAGKGERFGLGYNKLFYRLDDKPVLLHTLDAREASGAFDGATLVLSKDDMPLYEQLIREYGDRPFVRRVALGGETREASVRAGLACVPDGEELVAVHDGARPFVTPPLIRALIQRARERGSAVPAARLTDTVKRVDGEGWAVETPPRDALRRVQTPQVFRLSELSAAYAENNAPATDDAEVYQRKYGRAALIEHPDCAKNVKITTPDDLPAPTARVGTGYDAHRLAEGRPLVLCGVEIPYEKGLLGHSDADVATHALIDALLGAAALGDIGAMFPDSDPAYAGIRSTILLKRVAERLRENGFSVVNADVTIVAQRPKLAAFIPAMRMMLAEALDVGEKRVSVKATTTEGMGFEGTGEGISAQAVALVAARAL